MTSAARTRDQYVAIEEVDVLSPVLVAGSRSHVTEEGTVIRRKSQQARRWHAADRETLRGGRELFVTRDNHKDHSGVPRAAAGFSPAIHAGSICWDILGPAHQLQWLGRYCGRETPWSIPIPAHDAPRCARCKVEFISCRRASARQVPGSDCRPKFARRLPRGGCAAALRLLVKMRQGLAWVAAGRCRGRLPQYCASYCGSTDTVIHCVHCGIGTAVPVVVLWELFGHV